MPGEAVRELIWQDRDRTDTVGAAGEFVTGATGPPLPAPPPPLRPPPPAWHQEQAEREARERRARTGEEQHEPPGSLAATPARKKRRAKTPNLDAVRAWKGAAS